MVYNISITAESDAGYVVAITGSCGSLISIGHADLMRLLLSRYNLLAPRSAVEQI
jgi:hypothetical protein